MKKRIQKLLLHLLGYEDFAHAIAQYAVQQINEKWEPDYQKLRERFDSIDELSGRIDDLEAAYPDYKKAKAEADERKANEVIPGFRPFTQRKRAWEAQHRKAPENKKP